MVAVLLAASAARAVDPLPSEIERAPVQEQLRYLERAGRDSHEQKIQAGRQRHEARMSMRQAIHHQMAAEVASRQAQMAQAMSAAKPGLPLESLVLTAAVLLVAMVVLVWLIRAQRRTTGLS